MRLFAVIALVLVVGCAPEVVKQNVDAMQRGLKVIEVQSTETPIKELAGSLGDTGEAAVQYLGKPTEEIDIFNKDALAQLKIDTMNAVKAKNWVLTNTDLAVGGFLASIGLGGFYTWIKKKYIAKAVPVQKAANFGTRVIGKFLDLIKSDASLKDKAVKIITEAKAEFPEGIAIINELRLADAERDAKLNPE